MLTRLISLGRPAVEATGVTRAAAALAIEPSATSLTSSLVAVFSPAARDGGSEASTSYGKDSEHPHAPFLQSSSQSPSLSGGPWVPSPPTWDNCLQHHQQHQQYRAFASKSSSSSQSQRPPSGGQPSQPRNQSKQKGQKGAAAASQPQATPPPPGKARPAAKSSSSQQAAGGAAAFAPAGAAGARDRRGSTAAAAAPRSPATTSSPASPSPPPPLAATSSSAPSEPPSAAAAAAVGTPSDLDLLQGLNMESLMRVLLHPLPMGRVRNPALFSGSSAPVVQLGNELLFFDPAATLSSSMRALHVVRQILRTDGHVLVVNPNPAMRPLLREAAHLSLNSNVYFWYGDWQPGFLSKPNLVQALAVHCRPSARLLEARGLTMQNPLCPPGWAAAARRSAPGPHPDPLPSADVQRLLAIARQASPRGPAAGGEDDRRATRGTLERLVAAQTAESRLVPYGSQSARVSRGGDLSLVVSMDLSYGGDAVREAHARNIPTVSLLNAHSDASHVTFPVYGSEAHAGFQHWFLEWLLRVINMPLATTGLRKPQREPQEAAGAAAAGMAGAGAAAGVRRWKRESVVSSVAAYGFGGDPGHPVASGPGAGGGSGERGRCGGGW